ncbi:MAG TPA: GNAT family protein, partial [Phycisphaerales bacterium]|nr:GNAT family protein [Phycisphaerales bacterium]
NRPARPARAGRATHTGHSPIRTRRLVLRCLAESDLGEFNRVMDLSREHLDRWIPIVAPHESNTQAMKRCIALAANGDQTRSAWRRVACTPSGRLVGGFSIFAITRGLTSEGCAHWWVAADAVGHGYGREIVAAAVAHATRDLPSGLGLHAVHAAIHPDNAVSATLARRVGFIHTGICQPVRVGDRWERHDEYIFRVKADAIDGPDYGSNSTTSGGVGGSAGIASIPGIGSGVPSLATRS